MFKKILIANRGEIACRVIETARRMGISTVAVYSDADAKARHVRLADEAVHIGGAASADSYLKADVILKATKDSGAQAVHPGYGFLSENEAFAKACEKAGIKFIGPSAQAINAMGLKDKAKALMDKAGVPVVPGYQGKVQDPAHLLQEAKAIGFPVLIKAVAGGGGKGMRLVEAEKEFAAALESCKREAKASFGNDHVLIEKYITRPRHVEVQVFGDSHGNAVHLFERDCSLQRRHQKVVEEAPAPGLKDSVRAALGDAAVKAVQALGYENAGTIEFIMDSGTQDFFFMEMNTRLQVEHPVTEMVTGLDLVEWQLRVAAGETLPLSQDEIALNGHAFEVRLYAEDPAGEFLPQTGRVIRFVKPSPLYPPASGGKERSGTGGGPSYVRIDTGVDEEDEVTIHYDPMIAKIIVHGQDRDDAVRKMQVALAESGVAGLRTNQEFLGNIFAQKDFIKGKVDTGFIARYMDDLAPETYGRADQIDQALAAIFFLKGLNDLYRHPGKYDSIYPGFMPQHGVLAQTPDQVRGDGFGGGDPWASRDHWRMNGTATQSLTLMNRGEPVEIVAQCSGDDFIFAGTKASFVSFSGGVLTAAINGAEHRAVLAAHDRDLTLFRGGRVIDLHLFVHGSDDDAEGGEGRIVTPMPGKIVEVFVKQGDKVDKDQPLLIMEAMKMEMTIRAGCAGVVEELPVSANDQVQDGTLLVLITGEDGA
ncbi:MAG: acetyl/propionyl/methylcrotonyl-CoA carboxylase subunit alpha [Rhodospirillales bacterium]|nr:acetyl/propionyl/methylcrotonyl-CoA carboxylase subunit alpha [Rhodospirillales bacterium]MCB9995337.1 acetyl/propionyl/methylcrotonyl-CoA carboxylase subunit alpha [Rhodospirillales bacterium]